MKDKYFIDTNIIVYAFEPALQEKKQISSELIKNAMLGKGCISYQIIQEFLNVAIRKFEVPLKLDSIKVFLEKVLYPLCEVFASKELYLSSLEIQQRWQLSFYDSLVVAAAVESGCNLLYSEDLQHHQKIFDLTIVNPYL